MSRQMLKYPTRGPEVDRVEVLTSSGKVYPIAAAFKRGVGTGYVLTPDHQVLEVALRCSRWVAVRRVAPGLLPDALRGREGLLGDLDLAEQRWSVDHMDHVYVVVTFGGFEGAADLRDRLPAGTRAWLADGSTRDRSAAIRYASELVGMGSISTTRVVLIPRSKVAMADISDPACWVVWSS